MTLALNISQLLLQSPLLGFHTNETKSKNFCENLLKKMLNVAGRNTSWQNISPALSKIPRRAKLAVWLTMEWEENFATVTFQTQHLQILNAATESST